MDKLDKKLCDDCEYLKKSGYTGGGEPDNLEFINSENGIYYYVCKVCQAKFQMYYWESKTGLAWWGFDGIKS